MKSQATWATLMALGIWGFLTSSPILAAGLALPLALSLFRRWPGKVSEAQFQALGDFTLVSLLVVYVLMINEIEPRRDASRTFLFSLPLIFYSLAFCRFLLAEGTVPLARLIILTRFQKLGFSRFGGLKVDFGWPYAFMVLLASCAPDGDKVFLAFPLLATWCMVVMLMVSIGKLSRWTSAVVLSFSMLMGLGLGWGLQLGIQGAEALIQQQSAEWWKQGIVDPGLEKRATMLGKTAELQLSSSIHLRIELETEPPNVPFYLRSSVYDQWSGRDLWLNSQDVKPALPDPEGHYGLYVDGELTSPGEPVGRMWQEMRGQGWLALPERGKVFSSPGLIEVEKVGSEHFRGKSESDVIVVDLFERSTDLELQKELSAQDRVRYLKIDDVRKETSEKFLTDHNVISTDPEAMAAHLKSIFLAGSYTYSLEVEAPPSHISVLDDFLNHSKSGHCEYFATATVMLFRSRGIPARYCTGYMVHEREENLWIGRGRDAHAWTEIWSEGEWVKVETTPPTQSGPLSFQKIRRTWESWMFALEKWRYHEGRDRLAEWAPWMLVLVLLYFGWRFSREWRQGRKAKKLEKSRRKIDPGFVRFEKVMEKRHLGRKPHESWSAWRVRLESQGIHLPEHLCDSWSRWNWDPAFNAEKELEEELRSLRVES